MVAVDEFDIAAVDVDGFAIAAVGSRVAKQHVAVLPVLLPPPPLPLLLPPSSPPQVPPVQAFISVETLLPPTPPPMPASHKRISDSNTHLVAQFSVDELHDALFLWYVVLLAGGCWWWWWLWC